jgi:hypothetical protein
MIFKLFRESVAARSNKEGQHIADLSFFELFYLIQALFIR